jgi:hypothetical protein
MRKAFSISLSLRPQARLRRERASQFARDSLLEGNRFEISVPRCLGTANSLGTFISAVSSGSWSRRNSSIGLPRADDRRMIPSRRRSITPNPTEASKPLPIWRGTEISNPSPSAGRLRTIGSAAQRADSQFSKIGADGVRPNGVSMNALAPSAVSRGDNAAMDPNSVSPSPQPRSDSYGRARRDARGLFVRLFLPA